MLQCPRVKRHSPLEKEKKKRKKRRREDDSFPFLCNGENGTARAGETRQLTKVVAGFGFLTAQQR